MIDQQHALLIRILHQPGKEKEAPGEKIGREAFIYLDGDTDDFAQCGSCWKFSPEKERCSILGPDFEVDADDSCCLYEKGEPLKGLPLIERVTPEEAGFVNREVRCENCLHTEGNGKCNLFDTLNKKLPNLFNLDVRITAKGCCNAQTPK